jgi:hypothetical protein
MIQIKKIVLATMLFAGPLALAESSEFQHQTDAGKWEVTPGLSWEELYVSDNPANAAAPFNTNPSTSTDTTAIFANVKGEYGIMPMLSVGVKLNYEMDSISISPSNGNDPNGGTSMKASGLADPSIFVNGKNSLGSGSLRWGTNFSFSLAKHTINSSGTSEDENSGGMTLTPFVGYEMPLGNGVFGVRLKYDLLQTDRKVTNNSTAFAAVPGLTSYSIKNGNNLVFYVFYEANLEPVILGMDAGIAQHASSKIVFSQPVFGTSDVDAHDSMVLPLMDLYANWRLTPSIELLPKIGANVLNINEPYLPGTVAQSKIMAVYANVAARFVF